jgi:hypothetical protein
MATGVIFLIFRKEFANEAVYFMRVKSFLIIIVCVTCHGLSTAAPVSYNRDVRPILSGNCFSCHGFDAKQRKGELRLDTPESALDQKRDEVAIVPGNAAASAIIKRVTSTDPDEIMPPPEAVHRIDQPQIEILTRWINEGAVYEPHWSFVAPQRSAPPVPVNAAWVRNPIDAFVAARLDQENLSPSPEADKTTLLRRLTFDLTGLPPSQEELSAFLQDQSIDSYDKNVERLMASPHYGERMALPWLDAARYADSNGFQADGDNNQHVWRDWVIKAFNDNMPFDQFTIWQVAGDLLPDSSRMQKVATGFNRCHLLNGEGGAIPEEQRNVILFDRVDVTVTNWLGLTIACAQCHDHKYDPLTQKDYYSMMAFFNNVPETGMPPQGGPYRVADPWISTGNEEQMQQLDALDKKISELGEQEKRVKDDLDVDAVLAAAEAELLDITEPEWSVIAPLSMEATNGVVLSTENDHSIISGGEKPAKCSYTIQLAFPDADISGLRFEMIPDARFPEGGSGRAGSGNSLLSKLTMKQGEKEMRASFFAADFTQESFDLAGIFDDDPNSGWAYHPDVKKPHQLSLQLQYPLRCTPKAPLTVVLEFQSQHDAHMFGHFRVLVSPSRFPLKKEMLKPLKPDILTIFSKAAADRSNEEKNKLRQALIELDITGAFRVMRTEQNQLQAQKKAMAEALPRVMVMSDAQPRKTHVYSRGSYEMPLEEVSSNTPAVLPPMPQNQPKNRLGLARWLVSAENPLTARVQVNRIWQLYFGHGLVKSSENFGLQGDAPTHPELLDWLAMEFRESGWDVKHMHRLIVTSATYRQSSRVTAALLERDPENKLCARASRFRLSSLFLRDLALTTSGLLQPRLYGKPVYPYQPPSIWDGLAITKERDFTYPLSKGDDLYRRSIYTFWRRTVAPGNMFDMPARRTCVVKNSITSTPLHALTMMNDTTWVECARALAARVITQSNNSASWADSAFLMICQRAPDAREKEILQRSFSYSLKNFQADSKAAAELLGHGSSPRDGALDPVSFAALTHLCLNLFNLDEAMTRQ